METLLHLYQLPYDPMYPVVLPSMEKQLIDDSIAPIPMEPGKPMTYMDYHYKRNGVAPMSIAFRPLTGNASWNYEPVEPR